MSDRITLLRRLRGIIRMRKDEGFTFIEATISVVLLTIVFLGFTVTLLAFREWMDRAWAIRVMDQYANDILSNLDATMRIADGITLNQNQYGLGSFSLSVPQFNFNNTTLPVLTNNIFTYSAKPTEGVYVAQNNAAPQKLDKDFPPQNWKTGRKQHKFTITEFRYTGTQPWNTMGRQPYFYESMVQIYLSIKYERPRTVETPFGFQSKKFELKKRYMVSGFLKNHTVGGEESQ